MKLRRDLFSKLSENHPRLFLTAKRMRMLQGGSADNVLALLKTTVLLEADAQECSKLASKFFGVWRLSRWHFG